MEKMVYRQNDTGQNEMVWTKWYRKW